MTATETRTRTQHQFILSIKELLKHLFRNDRSLQGLQG